ncbi:conserved oligomeric golgi complex subunit 7 [Nannochloropsis gaditana CCMP526]|uniref:conserved oligomeric golgi complex subunit 7 n=1 Tax=Nannochloropsis gaditana (strain CCMP526) TaxID=1093141 RepID=UPI00029F632B|nr:conserved oligomeric golgi complex subunit 7 [Nannochloropsis gaditana CCMP526]EKU21277.1 conserved oligomeric golgi complex subunit 7 [Nannochloropsis gaditana CCMP526]|eukprot:XP_005855083.1 conserved oligomeric golgi complex subunit 7 [Nannochloropsis gaditana CCMP526]
MDLAPFSQHTFDARAWVESILTPEKRDGETLDAYVSAVSMQLQLLAQELNGELERGMMELTGSLPRAMTELCLLETSGRSLEQELGHVLAQVKRGGGGGLGGGLGEGEGGG